MDRLDHLDREALATRVRELEARLASVSAPASDLDLVTEQALKVLENSGIPALIYDTEDALRILAANACVTAGSGYSATELAVMNLPQLLAGDDAQRLERLLRLPRQGGFSSAGGWRASTRSGEVRHVEVSGYDLTYRSRRACFVMVQDATRRSQEQLSQQQLASIVDRSRDAILSQTIEGIVLSWNQAAERLFDWPAADIVGHHYSVMLPEEVRDQEVAFIQASLAAGRPIEHHETVRLHRNGTRLNVALSLAPLRDARGRIIGASSMLHEISMQKRAESLMSRTQAIGRIGGWQLECPSGRLYWTDETFRIHDLTPGLHRPELENAVACYAPEGQSAIRSALSRAIQDGLAFDLELPLITARGRRIWVRCIGEALTQDGRVVEVYGSLQDITTQRETVNALRASERELQSILNDAAEGMVVVGANGVVERFNLAARRLFGYPPGADAPLRLHDLVLELEFAPGDTGSAQSIRPMAGSRREVTGRRRDGSLFPLELSLSEISAASGSPRFSAVVRDITERKSWENRIYQLAYSDSLTGLPNRLLLRDRLEHAIAVADRNRSLVGVLFFDLDHFKAINDSHGHHVGDQLLRRIAERTRGCVREIDTVCRLGGDEFVVVLPELHEAADAAAVARKLLSTLSEHYLIDDRSLSITPTVGISIYPRDGADPDTLVRSADAAMYHAKESGKNRYWFYRPAAGV
jgi:diguanylate cyclase (GGDEF)-like protein/PAS domain S-box-containing protein